MTETRTVYRYENYRGTGPYTSGAIWAMNNAHNESSHPGWFVTQGMENDEFDWASVNRQYKAACASREALDAWFDGWQEQLEANGFHVVEYTVPAENVVDGRSGLQCAFKPVLY